MDEKITVLQLCEHFGGKDASLHGVARSFQWWLPTFDASHFRVLLCSRKAKDKAAEEMEKLDVSLLYLGYGKMDPRNLLKLLKILKEEKVDIIHAHGYGACTWGRIAGLIKNIPISAAGIPCLSKYFLAYLAIASFGEIIGNTLGINVGKRISINLTIAGQADDIIGLTIFPEFTSSLEYSVITSAALATSKTSSNPNFLRAVNTILGSLIFLN
jgi:hypothetical protein